MVLPKYFDFITRWRAITIMPILNHPFKASSARYVEKQQQNNSRTSWWKCASLSVIWATSNDSTNQIYRCTGFKIGFISPNPAMTWPHNDSVIWGFNHFFDGNGTKQLKMPYTGRWNEMCDRSNINSKSLRLADTRKMNTRNNMEMTCTFQKVNVKRIKKWSNVVWQSVMIILEIIFT